MNVVEICIPFDPVEVVLGESDKDRGGFAEMIRVFVVDDEKLVRRGIIGLIDWEREFGMEVVGDSGNSQETLEFLKEKR